MAVSEQFIGDEVFGEVFDENDFTRDITLPFEINLYLLRIPFNVVGVYHGLLFLNKLHLLAGKDHRVIAKFLGLSSTAFNDYKQKLIEANLIKLDRHKTNPKAKNITFCRVKRLSHEEMSRWLKTHGTDNQIELLNHWAGILKPISEEEIEQKQKQFERSEQSSLIFGESVEVMVKVNKPQLPKKKQGTTFPNIDYKSVLDGYRKYKGIGIPPGSAYEARYKKSIKEMFLAGYKVFDILQCMKFFSEACHKDGYQWMTHWTIETVMKKMPEWTAGKLKRPEMGDDLPEL